MSFYGREERNDLISGLSDLPANDCDSSFYPDCNCHCYTICLRHCVPVRTSRKKQIEIMLILLRQMDAAERLEMIREKFNLTETDPIPEQIINTWITWISFVKYNCKYDTNKLSWPPLSGNITRIAVARSLAVGTWYLINFDWSHCWLYNIENIRPWWCAAV